MTGLSDKEISQVLSFEAFKTSTDAASFPSMVVVSEGSEKSSGRDLRAGSLEICWLESGPHGTWLMKVGGRERGGFNV
jgi:hypothetical protein